MSKGFAVREKKKEKGEGRSPSTTATATTPTTSTNWKPRRLVRTPKEMAKPRHFWIQISASDPDDNEVVTQYRVFNKSLDAVGQWAVEHGKNTPNFRAIYIIDGNMPEHLLIRVPDDAIWGTVWHPDWVPHIECATDKGRAAVDIHMPSGWEWLVVAARNSMILWWTVKGRSPDRLNHWLSSFANCGLQ